MADMKLTPKEAKEEIGEPPKGPQYPYGLRICLDAESLKKLGYSKPLEVGSYVNIKAYACVASASSNQDGDGETRISNDIQIEELEISHAEGHDAFADKLY